MPYDAAMLAAVCREVNEMRGARCEKVYGMSAEEITVVLRGRGEGRRLYINAGSSNPRMCFEDAASENPTTPPSFCMMLRKHLGGAVFAGAEQLGSERAARLTFDTRDDMGFPCQRFLIVEIMNKYSNIILCRDGDRIVGAARPVDFTTSRLRQVLPGMTYEPPPKQDKDDILSADRDALFSAAIEAGDTPADKFLIRTYAGLSPLLCREIAYRAGGAADAPVSSCDGGRLWESFSAVQSIINGGEPQRLTLVFDKNGRPLEFSVLDILEYGDGFEKKYFDSPSKLIMAFYRERGRVDRVSQRGHDVVKLVAAARRRIERKLEKLTEEMERAREGDGYKRTGDIINSNLHLLSRGMTEAELIDYYDPECPAVGVTLDPRLSPSDNAQYYYKKYAKCKTSRVMTAEQIELAEAELAYIETVEDALSRADGDTAIDELRAELSAAGYAKAVKQSVKGRMKSQPQKPDKYITSGGYTVLCGKNNLQNDTLTMKTAEGCDWWFHVKGAAGSHAVMITPHGDEPSEKDFTEAAMIAAVNSSVSGGENVPVDYTQVKNIKKPSGSKPGYVTYKTNWTAYVTPDRERVAAMRVKK